MFRPSKKFIPREHDLINSKLNYSGLQRNIGTIANTVEKWANKSVADGGLRRIHTIYECKPNNISSGVYLNINSQTNPGDPATKVKLGHLSMHTGTPTGTFGSGLYHGIDDIATHATGSRVETPITANRTIDSAGNPTGTLTYKLDTTTYKSANYTNISPTTTIYRILGEICNVLTDFSSRRQIGGGFTDVFSYDVSISIFKNEQQIGQIIYRNEMNFSGSIVPNQMDYDKIINLNQISTVIKNSVENIICDYSDGHNIANGVKLYEILNHLIQSEADDSLAFTLYDSLSIGYACLGIFSIYTNYFGIDIYNGSNYITNDVQSEYDYYSNDNNNNYYDNDNNNNYYGNDNDDNNMEMAYRKYLKYKKKYLELKKKSLQS